MTSDVGCLSRLSVEESFEIPPNTWGWVRGKMSTMHCAMAKCHCNVVAWEQQPLLARLISKFQDGHIFNDTT